MQSLSLESSAASTFKVFFMWVKLFYSVLWSDNLGEKCSISTWGNSSVRLFLTTRWCISSYHEWPQATSDKEMHQQVVRKSLTQELPHVEMAFSNDAITRFMVIVYTFCKKLVKWQGYKSFHPWWFLPKTISSPVMWDHRGWNGFFIPSGFISSLVVS